MLLDDPPLLDLFTQLREYGLPLGIGEYELVLQAWQAGYGRSDREALRRLCRTVWVKSPEEAQIFELQFERWVPRQPVSPTASTEQTDHHRQLWTPQNLALAGVAVSTLLLGGSWLMWQREQRDKIKFIPASEVVASRINQGSIDVFRDSLLIVEDIVVGDSAGAEQSQENPTEPEAMLEVLEERLDNQADETVLVPIKEPKSWWKGHGLGLWLGLWLTSGAIWAVLQWRSRQSRPQTQPNAAIDFALTQQIQDEMQMARLGRVVPTGDYFPVTQRQMRQSWRYLRRMVRQGPPTEFDVEATVQAVGRQGLLLTPVLRPRRINRAEVLLLVDHDGSMVPFHGLTQRLVETAQQGGSATRADVYYFHNCPVGWLYGDPYQQSRVALEQALQSVTSDYAGMLIVSDGGAARGSWSRPRLELTEKFLDEVAEQMRYIAWLNPVPQDRWPGTTAEAIAARLPMFEFDRAGLDAAIAVLRGQRGGHL